MDRKTFDGKRSEARQMTGSLKTLYQELANAALVHFQQHGDTSYIADLYGDLRDSGKNFIRSVPFVKWLTNFAPVKIVEKRFVKDKDREAVIWPTKEAAAKMVEEASKITFWDFDPESQIINFEFGDILKALSQMVKRFENPKHMKARDAEAVLALGRVKDFIALLKPSAEAPANDEAPVDEVNKVIGEEMAEVLEEVEAVEAPAEEEQAAA